MRKSAITVHYINEGIDDGDIIRQDFFDIEGINNLYMLYAMVQDIPPKTVVKSLVDIK